MPLIKCHECGSDVSTEAKTCPKCGAPVKDKNAEFTKQVLGGVFVFAIIWMVLAASCSSDEPEKEAAADKKEVASQEEAPPQPVKCQPDDLQCNGDSGSIAAGVYCPNEIEKLAKFSVKWTDAWYEPKFSRFRWRDQQKGEITYVGDKAQFQNGFGAMQNVVYECDMAADGKTILDVRVRDGRM